MPVLESVFHLVFGRRGPRRTTSASPHTGAPAAPPAPPPAAPPAAPPPPAAAAPPPPPAAPAPTPAPAPEAAAPEAPAEPITAPGESPGTVDTSAPVEAPGESPGTVAEPPTSEAPPPAAPPPPPAPEPIPVPTPPIATPTPPAPPSDQLTPHFRLREFTVTSTGLANDPDAEELERIRFSAERMEKVRTLLGGKPITINSCFRSFAVNQAVGGVENSAHRKGYAVDFTCAQFGTPYQIVEFLKEQSEFMTEVDQLIFECSRWVHISFEPRPPRKEVLTGYYKPGQGKKVFYLPNLHVLRDDGHLPDPPP